MRRFYQESWQGIPFSAFTHVSFFHLANSKFYASFYEELFRRCGSWECLPAAWRRGKDKGAAWLSVQIEEQCALLYPDKVQSVKKAIESKANVIAFEESSSTSLSADTSLLSEAEVAALEEANQKKSEPLNVLATESSLIEGESVVEATGDVLGEHECANILVSARTSSMIPRVLSIGRGVGYLEKALLDRLPHMELHVNEPTTAGLRWLRECIPTERIYIGSPSTCLPPDIQYDVIYLSAVDYSIANDELAFAMRELRGQLAPGGRIICISASLLEEDSAIGRLVNAFKIGVRAVLHFFDLRRQQFWGWRRTRPEYHKLFNDAGFTNIQDGWLEDGFESYWISGELEK